MSKFSLRKLVLVTAGVLAATALAVTAVISASSANHPAEPDASLAKYGYTPALTLLGKNYQPSDERVFIVCGKVDVKTCGQPWNIDNEASYDRPLIYTAGDKVEYLEGPHVEGTTLNYWISVPPHFQDFANLTQGEQKALLSAMPTVAKALGTKPYVSQWVELPLIGKVQASINK